MGGLAAADITTLTSYEQYFVPAVVDYVNLLVNSLFTDGELTSVSKDNVASLKDTLAQIDTYFAHIPEAAHKYVTKADAVQEMREAVAAFDDTPETGDVFPWTAIILLGLALIAGTVCVRAYGFQMQFLFDTGMD